MKAPCTIPGCDKPQIARGWCSMHWCRWHQHGSPHYERPVIGFWDYVRKSEEPGCWIWTGSTKGNEPQKYGGFYFRGANWLAHRVSWVLTYGEIPKIEDADSRGTCVLHSCDTPLCVNPYHLFLGTHKKNMEDKVAKQRDTSAWKAHCKHGHLRNSENTWIDPKRGLKHCRVCGKLRMRKVYAQRRVSLR